MLTKLSEKLGESLAEHWVLTVFSPAFVFWAGGLVAYALHTDLADLLKRWSTFSFVEQATLIIAVMILIAFSATVVERVQANLLQIIEGYWPNWLLWLRIWLADRWWNKIDKKYATLDALANTQTRRGLIRKSQLDNELAHLPVEKNHTMPTLLGNLLAASERYSEVRYGLDPIVCWPRLYSLLSDTLRHEIVTARSRLNEGVRLFTWSILFLIWMIWQWWAVIGLVVAWLAYRGMIVATGTYGDLIRTAYDIHRFELYKALSWPVPEKPEKEEDLGHQLTTYLFRGESPSGLDFVHNKEGNTPKA